MQCLKCGENGVFHKNAEGVSDAGGCTINCTECGQPHDGNLMFNTSVVSLPMSIWQQLSIWGGIAVALAAVYGITLLF